MKTSTKTMENAEVREKSLSFLLRRLRKHQNTAAATYLAKSSLKNWSADMRGYDSVFDYLLAEQEVDRAMFDRQIDLIMKGLRSGRSKIPQTRGQGQRPWKMTFADWKLDLDSAQPRCHHWWRLWLGYEICGTSWWRIFPRNCSLPNRTLGRLCGQWRQGFRWLCGWPLPRPSLCPHELDRAHERCLHPDPREIGSLWSIHLLRQQPKLLQRPHVDLLCRLLLPLTSSSSATTWNTSLTILVKNALPLAHRLTDTYFHNFITHLLEAAFQRKVYTLIEEGGTFGASKLNSIMKEVLTEFWGDAVEIDDDAALTWMRQSHYYMGLYGYTYSAGLVISTAGYLHLKNSENGAKDWLDLLKSGGSKDPTWVCYDYRADISTDKPLRDTIQFFSDTVDQIIVLIVKSWGISTIFRLSLF